MISYVILLIVGLILLVLGGDYLVKSAVSFAKKLNVPPFLIGITIVSFGTSAPELMVSIQAALDSASGIAIGNVVGSNIANIGLVLGLTVIVKPILIEKSKYFLSWWVMLISSFFFLFFLYDNVISFYEGIALIICLNIFILLSIKYIKNDDNEQDLDDEKGALITFVYFFIGSAGLYFGSELFVNNAIIIAKSLGISEFIIGITIVAFGTSLPELVTSIVAITKNHNSISIGNLIGSNIFNILAVIGITALVEPLSLAVGESSFQSLLVMLSFSLLMGFFLKSQKIGRLRGGILVIGYLVYITFSLFT
jgi:cation:H+ antiporter